MNNTPRTKRLIAALAGVGLVLGSVTIAAPAQAVPPCTASSPDTSFACTYPGYGASTGTWADTRYLAPNHNCTRYAAFRLAQRGVPDQGTWSHAEFWDTNAAAAGYPVNGTPAVGAIAQWENSGMHPGGHVAHVDAVGSGWIEISDDSWGGVTRKGIVITTAGDWPDNFLHVADVSSPIPVDDIAWYQGTNIYSLISSGSSLGVQWTTGGIGTPTWSGVGDFNGDGRDDLAWYQGTTITIMVSNGSSFGIAWTTGGLGTPSWAGVGDFNGDGKDDIAWYQGTTIYALISNGSGFGIGWSAGGIGASTWADTGDFNGDGKDDIAWYQGTSIIILASSGSSFGVSWSAGGIGAASWAGAGDFNADGKDDIAWYQGTTIYAFISNGSAFGVGWTAGGIGSPTWAGVGDLTGDGKGDLAWYQGTTVIVIASSGSSFGVAWSAGGLGTPTWAGVGNFS